MKTNFNIKFFATLLCLIMVFTACGKNDLITAKQFDFYTKLREVEAVTAPVTKQLTEDMFLSQTEMNELSGKICEMWDEFLDEVEDVLEDNLSKKEYRAFEQEQEEWERTVEAEVKAYAAEFVDGSMAPLISNMEMTEKIKYRVYDLAKYFSRP